MTDPTTDTRNVVTKHAAAKVAAFTPSESDEDVCANCGASIWSHKTTEEGKRYERCPRQATAAMVDTTGLRLTFQHARTGTLHKAPLCGTRSVMVSPRVMTLDEIAEATKCGSCWDGTTYPVNDNNMRAAVGLWSKARGTHTNSEQRDRVYADLKAELARKLEQR